jgi:hypothetical protein
VDLSVYSMAPYEDNDNSDGFLYKNGCIVRPWVEAGVIRALLVRHR